MVERDAHLFGILVSGLQHIKYMTLMTQFLVLYQFHIMIFLLFSRHELAGNITRSMTSRFISQVLS